MDRKYKKTDTVEVRAGNRVKFRIRQKPYSYAGFDNYIYQGQYYPGFVDKKTDAVYIQTDPPE